MVYRLISFLLSLLILTTFPSFANSAIPPKNKAADPFPSDKKTVESFKPCQTRSPNSGSFFDLTPIHILPPIPEVVSSSTSSRAASSTRLPRAVRNIADVLPGRQYADAWRPQIPERSALGKRQQHSHDKSHALEEKDAEKEPAKSWHARGQDYPSNFSMNFCGPVVEEIKDVVGVDAKLWGNVSAFYIMEDKVFSLGNQNTDLTLRGKKLTLNYTGGSPCPKVGTENMDPSLKENWSLRRKSTLISLQCEKDPLAAKASISFVGTTDNCTYFFEAKSGAACAALQKEKQQVGPSGVFSLIAIIAFLVYLGGGIVYQRAVMHQRGWRQLPNYALWHGIFSFAQDVVLIGLSICSRCFGGAGAQGRQVRGFNQVPTANGFEDGVNGGTAGRGRKGKPNENDENRLIDELDEEWHD